MTKVTYWFGAGASAQVHPVISNFIEHVTKRRDELSIPHDWITKDEEMANTMDSISRELFAPLLNFLYDSRNFGTIDTLAKYYMITNPTEFERIKKLIQMYFLCEDFIRNRIDNRYLGLLTNISQGLSITNNINFITWNYDSQLYKAKAFLRGLPFTVPNWSGATKFDDSGSVVYYLNGTSFDLNVYQEFYSNGGSFNSPYSNVKNVAKKILYGYENGFTNSIKYAFENERQDLINLLTHLDSRIVHSEILVIIGYSFPFANRVTDSQILSRLNSVKKIYIQDINAHSIIDRVVQLAKNTRIVDILGKVQIPIVPITDTGSFYIPYEI